MVRRESAEHHLCTSKKTKGHKNCNIFTTFDVYSFYHPESAPTFSNANTTFISSRKHEMVELRSWLSKYIVCRVSGVNVLAIVCPRHRVCVCCMQCDYSVTQGNIRRCSYLVYSLPFENVNIISRNSDKTTTISHLNGKPFFMFRCHCCSSR